jgi:hypothetical protein
MSERLEGWKAIASYLGRNVRTAQRYVRTRSLPIHYEPGVGKKPPVIAYKADLDDWRANKPYQSSEMKSELPVQIFERVFNTIHNLTLFRRNYILTARLAETARGVQLELEYRFELCNATREPQLFQQELTIDDPDEGYVRTMSTSIEGGAALYRLNRPQLTEKPLGYSVFKGPPLRIPAQVEAVQYICEASWVLHRKKDDIFINALVMPTIGIEVKVQAPDNFDITPSFRISNLMMTSEHIDIAWNKRGRR